MTVVLGLAVSTVGVSSAQALTNISVSGTLDDSHNLFQYSTFRYHSVGPAYFQMVSYDSCGGSDYLGLRNTSGFQVTTSIQFGPLGTQQWNEFDYTTYNIPTASYAFNGRNTGGYCVNGNYLKWNGYLKW